MKCRFKTNRTLTANKATKHSVTTSDRKTINRKLACNPLKFQPSKKTEETRKPQKDVKDEADSVMMNSAKPIKE